VTMKHTTRLGWATALFTLAFAGTSLAVHRANSAAREEIAVHLAELRAEREAVSHDREALWGETTEGKAWPHYAEALEAMEPFRHNMLKTRILVALEPGVDDGSRAAVLAEVPDAAFDALRRGAHARDGEVEVQWRNELQGPVAAWRLLDARALQNAAALRLLLATSVEEEVDAVRSILDSQQLGHDFAESGLMIDEMMGIVLARGDMLAPLFERGLADQLSEAAKREWLAGLRRLEAQLAVPSHAMRGELEMLAGALTEGWTPEWSADASTLERLADYVRGDVVLDVHVADHLERMRATLPEIVACHSLEPAQVLDRMGEITAEIESWGNPVSPLVTPSLRSITYSRMRCRGQLSFLRHALEVHLGEEGEPPLDPFGLGVDVEVEDARVRIRTPLPAAERSRGNTTLELVL